MTYQDIRVKILSGIKNFNSMNEHRIAQYILVHPEQFLKIINSEDPAIQYDQTKDGWGRCTFLHLRVIRSIDVNNGEIIVCG